MIDQCLSCGEPYCDLACCVDVFCEHATGLCDPCAAKAGERCPDCSDTHTADMESAS